MYRLIIILLATAFIACGIGDASRRPVDAGPPTGTPSLASARPAEAANAPTADAPSPRPHEQRRYPRSDAGASPAPPDPRVTACVARASGSWAELDACLRAEVQPYLQPLDAGAAHRLGAVRPPPICAAQSVPSWYISPASGNDTNSCVDTAHPCKTYREITSRWGCGAGPVTNPVITTSVQVVLLDSQTGTSDRVIFDPILNEGGLAFLNGQWTMVATGAISGLVAKSTSASDPRLQMTLGAAATGHMGAGAFLVNTTRSNSVAAIHGVLSGTTVAVTQPMVANVPAFPARPLNPLAVTFPGEDNTWANGDTWQIWQLPSAYLTSARPLTAEDNANFDINFLFVQHLYIPDPAGSPGSTENFFSTGVQVNECQVDAFVSNVSLPGFPNTFTNTRLSGGTGMVHGVVLGGSIDSNGSIVEGVTIDQDAVLGGDIQFIGSPSIVGAVGVAGHDIDVFTQMSVLPGILGVGHLYGTYTLDVSGASGTFGVPGATVAYDSTTTAVGTFLGHPTIQIDHNATAVAKDFAHTPSPLYPNIGVSPANLDAAVASGGFGGTAFGYAGSLIAPARPATAVTPSAYFQAGSGIAITTGGVGSALTISTTAVGGVSSVTCSGSVSCSPTTGAVVVTGTNATVSSGTGITVTGGPAYTVALTTPVSAGNGGTGASSPNAHAMLATEGASPMTAIGPCSTGQAIVYAGGPTSDPVCSTLTVPGGGTGVTTVPVGYLLTGGIGSAMALLAPGHAGNVVTDTGSVWTSAVPAYQDSLSCSAATTALSGGSQVTICSVTVTPTSNSDIIVVSADYHTSYDFSQSGAGLSQNFVGGLGVGSCGSAPVFTESYDLVNISTGSATLSGGTSMHKAFSLGTTAATSICAVMSAFGAHNVNADANLVVQLVTH